MEKQFNVSDLVWARARKPKSEIFWPAQVVETEKNPRRSKKKVIASVKFLGENTYEDVKDAKDIMGWDCKEQNDLIQSGRASLKKPQKKICFNKGVAEARKMFALLGGNVGMVSDDKNIALDETPMSNKGNKSSDIKFINDSNAVPIVREETPKNNADEYGRNEEKKDDKAAVEKQNNTNDTKEDKANTDEPKGKRSKGIAACESLIRSSLRKTSRKDSTTDKANKTKSATVKDILNEKGTSPSMQFVANTSNDKKKNKIETENSSASNRKRKREEEAKQNGLENKLDKKLNDSKSPAKVARKEEKSDAKQKMTGINQKSKESIEKRPIPNNKEDTSCRMEEEKSKEEWESDSCSDDELMETALSPSSKNYKFEFNDVVWAKLYRDPFWPAQVKRIMGNKKPQKIYVQFLGYDNKSCFSCKRLVPFACDSEKREEFMKEAEVLDPQRFDMAFTMAEDLVRRKALGIKDLNEEEEGCDLVDTDEVKENSNDGKEVISSAAEDEPEKETFVRKSSRNVKRPSKYKDILTYIREAKPLLKEIFEEKRPCERHQIFKKGSAKDKNSLKRRSGFGPVADSDLENDIMELLQDYYREMVGNKEDFSKITYISDVWLPEAIIYGLQKMEKVDRKTAESMFQQGSSHETQSHRFTQRLKAKTLTQEEKEESLQRAEKSFRAPFNK